MASSEPQDPRGTDQRAGADDEVAALLAHGAKPDGTPLDRPVVNALWAGDPMTAALLMRHADLRLPFAHTDVRVADAALAVGRAERRTPAVVRTLLARGADPNRTDLMTPLMRASFYGHDDVVATLLDHGANPNDGRGDQDICFGPPLAGIQQGAKLAGPPAGIYASVDSTTPGSGATGALCRPLAASISTASPMAPRFGPRPCPRPSPEATSRP